MDTIMQIETNLIVFIQHLGAWLKYPMQAFTFLGNEYFFLLFMPALFWSVDPLIGFRAGMMLMLSGSVNGFFKTIFHSPRPYWVDPNVKAYASETSFGLPSGHSQNSAAIWGIFAASVKKKWLTIAAIVLIFLIGLSRLYLGVHLVRDVLAGWLIGGLLVLLYMKVEKVLSPRISRLPLTAQILLGFGFSLFLIGLGLAANWLTTGWVIPQNWVVQAVSAGAAEPNPFNLEGYYTVAGVAFGFITGYAIWLRKFKKYLLPASVMKRLGRYLIGLAGIISLYLGLKTLFPSEPEFIAFLFRFIRYALIGFWVSFVAPYIFQKTKLES